MSGHKLSNPTIHKNQQIQEVLASESLVIDWDKAQKIMNGNLTEAKLLLRQLLDYIPDTLKSIQKAAQANDSEQLLIHVHKLHGACSYCGVPRLKMVAKALESALRSQNQVQIAILLPEVQQECKLLLKAAEQDIILNEK